MEVSAQALCFSLHVEDADVVSEVITPSVGMFAQDRQAIKGRGYGWGGACRGKSVIHSSLSFSYL